MEEGTASAKPQVPEWAHVEPATGERHLPIYFLVDTSASMKGAPLASVRQGFEQLRCEFLADPYVRDVARIGVITFGKEARFVTNGLVPAESFHPPELTACVREVTRLDLAFRLLRESLDRDVERPVIGGSKGDWRPVVFVLLDGMPTDEHGKPSDVWQAARRNLLDRPQGQVKPATIVAFGFGSNVDEATLQQIGTEGADLHMGTAEAAFLVTFQLITQSALG